MDLSNANDRAIGAHTNELGDEAAIEEWIERRAKELDDNLKDSFLSFCGALAELTSAVTPLEVDELFQVYKTGDAMKIGTAFHNLVLSANYNCAKKELES